MTCLNKRVFLFFYRKTFSTCRTRKDRVFRANKYTRTVRDGLRREKGGRPIAWQNTIKSLEAPAIDSMRQCHPAANHGKTEAESICCNPFPDSSSQMADANRIFNTHSTSVFHLAFTSSIAPFLIIYTSLSGCPSLAIDPTRFYTDRKGARCFMSLQRGKGTLATSFHEQRWFWIREEGGAGWRAPAFFLPRAPSW